MFYRRLSTATKVDEIEEIRDELRDRFGPLPEEAERLLDMVHLKIWLTAQGITALQGKKDEIIVSFSEESTLDRSRLVTLIQEDPKCYKLSPSQKLVIRMKMPDTFHAYLQKLCTILKQFLGYDRNSDGHE
jgi:transcription-repair coupling factor (superfamily II helicase)